MKMSKTRSMYRTLRSSPSLPMIGENEDLLSDHAVEPRDPISELTDLSSL